MGYHSCRCSGKDKLVNEHPFCLFPDKDKCPEVKGGRSESRGFKVYFLASFAQDCVDEDVRYQGYNKDLIDRFVNMGFDVDRVVDAFNYVNIDRNDGQDYELEEAYMGDITARLLGEP
jgi:hypothetical protein